MTRPRIRRLLTLLAAAGALAVVVLAWPYVGPWPRFYSLFEYAGVNDQGYPEYRHRQTGIVMVRVPGGTFKMGMGDVYEVSEFVDLHVDSLEQEEDENLQEEDEKVSASARESARPTVRWPSFRPPDSSRRLWQLFWRAAPKSLLDAERPVHDVELSPFLLAKYEVTQEQWERVLDSNPSWRKGDSLPLDTASWEDAHEFCVEAGLRLPTEAQWEYACRARTTARYGGTGELDDMGWYSENSRGTTHPVGLKMPNAFGLYDMHGNVAEWCEDSYDREFYSKLDAAVKDPLRSSRSTLRVNRGGCWFSFPRTCRSAYRSGLPSSVRYEAATGLRPAFYPLPPGL